MIVSENQLRSTFTPLNIFYIFSLFIFLNGTDIFWQPLLPENPRPWAFPLGLFAWVPRDVILTATGVAFGASALWAIFQWKNSRWPRALFFLSFLFFDAAWNSGGKINKHNTAWLFVSFFAIFCPKFGSTNPSPDHAREDADALFLLRASLLVTYFQSGLWKLKYFVRNPDEIFNAEGVVNLIADHWLTAGVEPNAFVNAVLRFPTLLQIGNFSVMLLQVSGLLLLFTGKFNTFLGLAFLGFHLMTNLLLSITFSHQAMLCVILFLSPAMFKIEKIRPYNPNR
jgi:hypothetical protein